MRGFASNDATRVLALPPSEEMFLEAIHKTPKPFTWIIYHHLCIAIIGLSGTDSERWRIMKRLGLFSVGFCVGLGGEVRLKCEK